MKHLILDDFLSESECKGIIELAAPHLQVTTSWDVEKGVNQVTSYRIGDQYFFQRNQNEFISTLEAKIEKLTGIPQSHGEGMQYIRYGPSGHYLEHFDYFDPAYKGNASQLARGGQRVMTVICYLNTVEDGTGVTWFPVSKVSVRPIQGRALMFWNVKDNGDIDPSTLHTGTDVGTGMEKHIITKWLRERDFV